MRRSSFKQKSIEEVTNKPTCNRKCSVRGCKLPAIGYTSLKAWCSPEHGAELAQAALAKKKAKEAKEERANDRKRKNALKKISEHEKATERVINRYVRLRDYYEGCISCNKPWNWHGKWHASHYKSVGSNSKLRFHLWNIHKACDQCNWFKSGNIGEYTERLREKFGQDRVQWLEDRKNGSKEYSVEYLDRLRKVFLKKCARREKKLGIR